MPPTETSKGQIAVLVPPRLPPPPSATLEKYGIDDDGWRTLVEATFPSAKSSQAVVMALDYCQHRKLDPFKHPIHIVPVYNAQLKKEVETIWPGIAELRTTAMRTGQYAGMDVPLFGAMKEKTFRSRVKKWNSHGDESWEEQEATVTFPEWCQITVYRVLGGNRVPFPGPRVHWLEAYARRSRFSTVPNDMWEKRAIGQLEKCAEAAALRRAFPEELGSDYSVDEIGAFTTHEAARDVTDEGSATTSDVPAQEPQRSDPKYQESAGVVSPDNADPAGLPAGKQPENVTSDSPRGGDGDSEGGSGKSTSGPAASRAAIITDVPEDRSALDDGEEAPPIFEEYVKAGDFFLFADEYLNPAVARSEAEYLAFSAFYYQYMKERLDPAWRSRSVHDAMLDTKRQLDAAIAAAQKRAKQAS